MTSEDDGIAIVSVAHPIGITEEMIEAGCQVLHDVGYLDVSEFHRRLVRDIYDAMARAAPEDFDISPDALETVDIPSTDLDGEIL